MVIRLPSKALKGCFALLFHALFGCAVELGAQQATLQTLYWQNPMGWNPAAAGAEDDGCVLVAARQQWIGLDGAPSSQWAGGSLPLFYLRSGAGLMVANDLQGALRRTEVSAAWGYRIVGTETLRLTAGLGVSLVQASLDGSRLRAPDGNYEGGSFTHNDGIVPEGNLSAASPDLSLGVDLRYRGLRVGLSATGLLASRASLTPDQSRQLRWSRNYNLGLAYDWAAGRGWGLRPSLFLRTDGIKMQLDAGVSALIGDNIFTGISFRGFSDRSADALCFSAGLRWKNGLSVAYAYDAGISPLRSVQTGTHELLLSYRFRAPGKGRPPRIIYTPRFL